MRRCPQNANPLEADGTRGFYTTEEAFGASHKAMRVREVEAYLGRIANAAERADTKEALKGDSAAFQIIL